MKNGFYLTSFLILITTMAFAQQALLPTNKLLKYSGSVDGKPVTFSIMVTQFNEPISRDTNLVYWGVADTGQSRPFTTIKSIKITYDSKPIFLPINAVNGLANPTSAELISGKEGIFKIKIGLSDAAASMEVIFTFDHDEIVRREVWQSELHELCEDIHYPHWHRFEGVLVPDWSRWEKFDGKDLKADEGQVSVLNGETH